MASFFKHLAQQRCINSIDPILSQHVKIWKKSWLKMIHGVVVGCLFAAKITAFHSQIFRTAPLLFKYA